MEKKPTQKNIQKLLPKDCEEIINKLKEMHDIKDVICYNNQLLLKYGDIEGLKDIISIRKTELKGISKQIKGIAPEALKRACTIHKKPKRVYKRIPNTDITVYYPCSACQSELKASELKATNDRKHSISIEKAAQIDSKIKTTVPERFIKEDFDTYEVTNEWQKKAIADIKWFCENWKTANIPGLIATGTHGAGKDHLGYSIIKNFIRRGYSAEMKYILDFSVDIRDAQNRGGSIKNVVDNYARPDLLILNEIGVQHCTDNERIYASNMIDKRYQALKPTILISNLNTKDIIDVLGKRIVERIIDGGTEILMPAEESYRATSKQGFRTKNEKKGKNEKV